MDGYQAPMEAERARPMAALTTGCTPPTAFLQLRPRVHQDQRAPQQVVGVEAGVVRVAELFATMVRAPTRPGVGRARITAVPVSGFIVTWFHRYYIATAGAGAAHFSKRRVICF